MNISVPYYEDLSRISNSNIGWFLEKGPAYLHKMLTDPPEEEKNHVLERGSMIHEYILQPEEFQKDYVVWNEPKPTSVQQETFCRELANTLEIEPDKAILSAYKNAYSTKGKNEAQMLSDGQEMALKMAKYIDFIKSGDKRRMISMWDIKMLEKIKQNIESHKLAKPLIFSIGHFTNLKVDDTTETFGNTCKCEAHHEFHINWDFYGDMPIACKSLLDGLTIDFNNKKVIIYDLKTTQKLWHFEDSIKQYDYCRQLMYYTMAVQWYLIHECEIDNLKDWIFEWYIIGIDTTGTGDIRVFRFEQGQIYSRSDIIEKALTEIAWHQQNNLWEHSMAYYEGDGSESLTL